MRGLYKKRTQTHGCKKWHRYGISIFYIVLLASFCYSAYKLANGLVTAKTERDAFRELSENVSKSTPTIETPSVQNDVTAKNGDTTSSEDKTVDNSSAASTDSPRERTPLQQYLPLFEMNPDFFGWLSIEGTDIDFPVMYTPDRPEYYLERAFDGSFSYSGVPFIDERCSADGNYYLIYGHHMRNKTMFGQIPKYADQSFYEEHPLIRFDTLYEQREYRVVAAFYSRVYGKDETGVFRYYDYYDLSDEEVFDEYMNEVKAAAIYDTGVEVSYGDELLVLSTCNYHTDNGRFVVVAKREKEEVLAEQFANEEIQRILGEADPDCTWSEKTTLGEPVLLYDPYDVCNGYVYKLYTNGNEIGYIQINCFDNEFTTYCYSYTGVPAYEGLSEDFEGQLAASKNGHLHFFGNVSYCIKITDNAFRAIDGIETFSVEEAVTGYERFLSSIKEKATEQGEK